MNIKMINVMMFAAGAIIGSLATWKYVKTKYERIAQEEIDSVKDAFQKHEEDTPYQSNAGEMDEYAEKARLYSNTATVSSVKNEQKGGVTHMAEKPYIIGPDDFGEEYDYETTTLTYYADGVLEDDYYVVIDKEEVDDMVGLDSFNHFGEYEKDTVFVRNERLKTDFEIQRDLRKYSETTHESLQNGY